VEIDDTINSAAALARKSQESRENRRRERSSGNGAYPKLEYRHEEFVCRQATACLRCVLKLIESKKLFCDDGLLFLDNAFLIYYSIGEYLVNDGYRALFDGMCRQLSQLLTPESSANRILAIAYYEASLAYERFLACWKEMLTCFVDNDLPNTHRVQLQRLFADMKDKFGNLRHEQELREDTPETCFSNGRVAGRMLAALKAVRHHTRDWFTSILENRGVGIFSPDDGRPFNRNLLFNKSNAGIITKIYVSEWLSMIKKEYSSLWAAAGQDKEVGDLLEYVAAFKHEWEDFFRALAERFPDQAADLISDFEYAGLEMFENLEASVTCAGANTSDAETDHNAFLNYCPEIKKLFVKGDFKAVKPQTIGEVPTNEFWSRFNKETNKAKIGRPSADDHAANSYTQKQIAEMFGPPCNEGKVGNWEARARGSKRGSTPPAANYKGCLKGYSAELRKFPFGENAEILAAIIDQYSATEGVKAITGKKEEIHPRSDESFYQAQKKHGA